jgi:enoyl-[acyl-carrier protein] reductase II
MKNRVCEILSIKYPIMQGGMTWITNARMVSAISNAGGMGVIGFNAGQTDMTPDPVETASSAGPNT